VNSFGCIALASECLRVFQQIGREQAVPVAIALAQDHAAAHAIGCRVDVAAARSVQMTS